MYIEWVLVVSLYDESDNNDTLSSFVYLWYKSFVFGYATYMIVLWWVYMNVLETLVGPYKSYMWLIDLVW